MLRPVSTSRRVASAVLRRTSRTANNCRAAWLGEPARNTSRDRDTDWAQHGLDPTLVDVIKCK